MCREDGEGECERERCDGCVQMPLVSRFSFLQGLTSRIVSMFAASAI
jgi:hypothetical protein